MRRFLIAFVMLFVFVGGLAVSASGETTTLYVGGLDGFATIQAAVNAAASGDTITIRAGAYYGARIEGKQLTIVGEPGAVIDDGPLHHVTFGRPSGIRLAVGSSGTVIQSITFDGVDLAIYSKGPDAEHPVDEITVEDCTFHSSLQAITNWGGSDWTIAHNKVVDLRTANGGGIGIFIGDHQGGVAQDNLVEHNDVTGVLSSAAGELGGYAGTGIVLYADWRWGSQGSTSISGNVIEHNNVELTAEDPDLVPVVGIELTEAREPGLAPVITDNEISFNDVRGTDDGLALSPESLGGVNDIFRNLGIDLNRGFGDEPPHAAAK